MLRAVASNYGQILKRGINYKIFYKRQNKLFTSVNSCLVTKQKLLLQNNFFNSVEKISRFLCKTAPRHSEQGHSTQ